MVDTKQVCLYGAGGHANVVGEIFAAIGTQVVNVFDDNLENTSPDNYGVRLLGNKFPKLDFPVVVTIGDNWMRFEIVNAIDAEFATGIHPSAIVSPSAQIGVGTVVLQGALIQAKAIIGKHALINTGASVDHDCVLGDFVHISPQAAICGHVTIGEGTHVGAGAVVIPSIKIGKWSTIGAGAVVTTDIPDHCTAVGNPARVIKHHVPLLQDDFEFRPFDLALIGSGLSSTILLCRLVEQLENDPPSQPMRIAWIERRDFFGGVAYGERAGFKSLIITDLKEFLPPDTRQQFEGWLNNNKQSAFAAFREQCGAASAAWFEKNAVAIEKNAWSDLFLPRYIFGLFLQHLATTALSKGVAGGLIDYQLIQGEVTDAERVDDQFRLKLTCGDRQKVKMQASRVVMCIGSPPAKRLFDEKVYHPKMGALLVNDPYHDGMTQTVDRIANHFVERNFSVNNLLLIGSNATTIEAIFNLYDSPSLMERLGKIIVLSTSGKFPESIIGQAVGRIIEMPNLRQLESHSNITAKEICDATITDIALARQSDVTFSDSFGPITEKIVQLIQRLDLSEKQEFVDKYGVEIGRHQRRAGEEYSKVVNELQRAGKLECVSGNFEKIVSHHVNGCRIEIRQANGDSYRLPIDFQTAVNCTGFECVTPESSSPLIQKLIKNRLIVPNGSLSGVCVDENLTASPDFFVLGPLMGGNIIGTTLVWHAEHCGRIIQFGQKLADHISEHLIRVPTSGVSG